MTIRSLRDGEQDACLDLWDAGFASTPRDYFVKYFAHDPAWRPDDTVVAEQDGRLVSVVHVVRRPAYCADGLIGVGGVANVATHPEFRGQGLNTACLRELQRRMAADPFFEIGMLGTGIHDYYARLGWQRTSVPSLNGQPRPDLPAPALAVRPATESDLPTLNALHAAHYAGQALVFTRTEPYWRGWLGWKPEGTWLTDDSSGYLRLSESDERSVVYELAGTPAALAALLTHAVGRARGRCHISAPLTPTLRALAADLLTDLVEKTGGGTMLLALSERVRPLPETIAFVHTDGF